MITSYKREWLDHAVVQGQNEKGHGQQECWT